MERAQCSRIPDGKWAGGASRGAPPYHAKPCLGRTMQGLNGCMYQSRAAASAPGAAPRWHPVNPACVAAKRRTVAKPRRSTAAKTAKTAKPRRSTAAKTAKPRRSTAAKRRASASTWPAACGTARGSCSARA